MRSWPLLLALLLFLSGVQAQGAAPRQGTATVRLSTTEIDVQPGNDSTLVLRLGAEIQCDTGTTAPMVSVRDDPEWENNAKWAGITVRPMGTSGTQSSNYWIINSTYQVTVTGYERPEKNVSTIVSWWVIGEPISTGVRVPPSCSPTGTKFTLIETQNLTLKMRGERRQEPPGADDPRFYLRATATETATAGGPAYFEGTSRVPTEAAFTMAAAVALVGLLGLRWFGRR